MLKIAVCDDQETHLKKTAGLLNSYFDARPALEGKVTLFNSGRSLVEGAAEQGGFDLYVLDILMPEYNGIETGRRLRELGEGGEIIYLTNANDFAADSYDVRAFFYLLKTADEGKFFSVLDKAVEKLNRRRKDVVVVHTAEGPRRLLLERIRYVERIGRIMRYNCTDGTVDSRTLRVSFREMAGPLLADPRFYLCGASFVLNLQHVTGVKGQAALLDNEKSIILPRTAAAAFKTAWGKFWLEGG